MRLFQVTDCHLKNEEPFFRAGVALDNFIIEQLKKETEPFTYLDSGDRFHLSKETGRVNGEVTKFFLTIANIPNCEGIVVMQGNHDVKEETGSALDLIRDLYGNIMVVDTPSLLTVFRGSRYDLSQAEFIYLLPHVRPYSIPGYSTIKAYGSEDFHRNYWKARGENWEDIKNKIKLVSFHGGDETTGKFFMNADISFLPGIRSNGHVHKQVSKNHLPSAMVTRRDEIDKKCFIRHIDTEAWTVKDIEIPLFLNYAQIPYGESVESYFKSGIHILPKESLIVDIYGHDDKELVTFEYNETWSNTKRAEGWPIFYIGDVTSAERRGDAVPIEERDDLDISSINIKELFQEFCEEKKLAKAIVDDLMARIE
jgi:hypothetical protein